MNVANVVNDTSVAPERSKRSVSGIHGLDTALGGGFPCGRTTIVVGGPGAGKTILAAEYLLQGAAQFGEPGLLVSFEESSDAIASNLRSLRLPFDEVFGSKLLIIDGRMPLDTVETGSFDLSGLIAVISAQMTKFGLRRIVLDGIDALFAYSGSAGHNRREVQRLLEWLSMSGLTAIVTVKSSPAVLVPASVDFLEYFSDGVIHLDYRVTGNVLSRKLVIVKLRGCGYMSGEHGFILSERGLELSVVERGKAGAPLSETRLSTGVEALDQMLGGGYRQGTVTLISGLPGTAKTTLACAFLSVGCAQGRSAVLIGLDETPDQIMLDLRSVGLDLKKLEEQGLLHTASLNAGSVSIDEQFIEIEHLLERYAPELLVFDPISAYAKAFGLIEDMSQRLTSLIKARGITAIFTAVSDSRAGEIESTSVRVSTVADNWIHLSYAVQRGERNRTLTIVKARGIAFKSSSRAHLDKRRPDVARYRVCARRDAARDGSTGTRAARIGGTKRTPIGSRTVDRSARSARASARFAKRRNGARVGRTRTTEGRDSGERERARGDWRNRSWRALAQHGDESRRPADSASRGHAANCMTVGAASDEGRSGVRLLLFVAGESPNSVAALENIRVAIEEQGAENFRLEVIDVFLNPERALADQIIVTPTLMHPPPASSRRLIGDLSARAELRSFLALKR